MASCFQKIFRETSDDVVVKEKPSLNHRTLHKIITFTCKSHVG